MGVGPPLLGGEGHASRTIPAQRRRDAAVHRPGLRSGAGGFSGRFSRRSVPPDRRGVGSRRQSRQQHRAAHSRHRRGLCPPRGARGSDQYFGRGLSDAPAPLLPPQFPRQRRPELAQGRLYLRPEYPLSPLPLGHGLLLSTGRYPGYGAHRRDAGAAVVQRHFQCRSSASYRDRIGLVRPGRHGVHRQLR